MKFKCNILEVMYFSETIKNFTIYNLDAKFFVKLMPSEQGVIRLRIFVL